MTMTQLTLFESDDRPDQASRLAPKLRALAEPRCFSARPRGSTRAGWEASTARNGMSSAGRFSQKRFEAECLREYAETFPVVGGDFSFYQFPSPAYWKKLFDETPADAQVRAQGARGDHGPEMARPRPVWQRGGQGQPRVPRQRPLPRDVHLAAGALPRARGGADPRVRHIRQVHVPQPAEFLARLEPFLGSVSRHFRYSVEIRNPEYLGPDYFSLLHSHNTAHVFNAWTRMPELLDQIDMPGAFTADFTVVRALLKKGRAYEAGREGVHALREGPGAEPRCSRGLRRIADRAWKTRQPAYVFVNNRLEGNAPGTIEAVVDVNSALNGSLAARAQIALDRPGILAGGSGREAVGRHTVRVTGRPPAVTPKAPARNQPRRETVVQGQPQPRA